MLVQILHHLCLHANKTGIFHVWVDSPFPLTSTRSQAEKLNWVKCRSVILIRIYFCIFRKSRNFCCPCAKRANRIYRSLQKGPVGRAPYKSAKGALSTVSAFNHERAPTLCLQWLKALEAWTQNNVQWNNQRLRSWVLTSEQSVARGAHRISYVLLCKDALY